MRNVEFRTDKYFGFAVPTALPGVPSEILDPVKTWKDKAEFDKTARALVGMFQKNFAKFEAQVDADVRAAAPDLKRNFLIVRRSNFGRQRATDGRATTTANQRKAPQQAIDVDQPPLLE